jgi:hypothetical protein
VLRFDQFGPLSIRPCHGAWWAARTRPARLRATYHRTHGNPGGYRLFVIMDNLSANKTPAIRRWARRENVELCFTPTSAPWANPRRNSGRYAPLSWAALTTPATQSWPQAPGLPALAQRQRPPSRRPGRPAPRTRPHPQRTPATLGPPQTQSRMIKPVNVHGRRTSEARSKSARRR